ncbi:hypothetical protein HR09_06525 [Porphyromonas gulae]|nr:hypothetical protein HR09_06525 [Porphyromonas gulae]
MIIAPRTIPTDWYFSFLSPHIFVVFMQNEPSKINCINSLCTFHVELSAKKEGEEYAQDESRRGERIGIKKKEQARQPDLLFPL